jgi:hypothetical protein
MKRMNLMTAVLALLACSSFVMGQTVQLSTGFDNTLTVQAPYPNPTVVSNQPDNYWINIASSPNTPAGPSWVLHSPQASWWPTLLPNSRWISAWKTAASQSGTSLSNPSYTIFRKCFCLQRGYQKASLSFQVRGDDNINAYLNSTLNQVLTPSSGQWNSPLPLQSLPSNPAWFRTGKNCLYVYLEDAGGFMGFDLSGSVSALGLLPTPASGTNGSFEPCACNTGPIDQSGGPRAAREASVDEEQVVKEILKIAEARRNGRKN